jgi:hypothetical protein
MMCHICAFLEAVGREYHKCAVCGKQICDACKRKNHLATYLDGTDICVGVNGWMHDECIPTTIQVGLGRTLGRCASEKCFCHQEDI